MIARLLVALGSSAAAVGFTIFGMATTYIKRRDDIANTSYILMGAGLAATIIGIIWYRYEEQKAEEAIRARSSPQSR